MEVQNAKLTRTSSSLRSLTVRSPASSLSTVDEENPDEEKPHNRPHPTSRFPTFPIFFFLPFTLLLLFFLFFHLREDFPLLAHVIIVASVAASAAVLLKKSRLFPSRRSSVQWSIGDDDDERVTKKGRAESKVLREGVEFYSNGDCYEGEFHEGRCNGSGIFSFVAKGRYEGDWIDGKYDGFGVETWARGSRYRGQYRHGMRHGFGVYRFFNGDSYAGEWLGGQSHGIGVQSCADGSCYAGEFRQGVKHGLGCYHFRNGDKYSGEYFGDKIHGFGVYNFANGHCYEGSWHEGRRQGFGSYAFRTGEPRSGEWDYGVLKVILLPSEHAVRRAVQAARKAAEDGALIPRVEKQVNEAVVLANRAATAARVAAIKAVQNRIGGNLYDANV